MDQADGGEELISVESNSRVSPDLSVHTVHSRRITFISRFEEPSREIDVGLLEPKVIARKVMVVGAAAGSDRPAESLRQMFVDQSGVEANVAQYAHRRLDEMILPLIAQPTDPELLGEQLLTDSASNLEDLKISESMWLVMGPNGLQSVR